MSIEYGDPLLMDCLVQACAILLHDNEGIVVSPPKANGELLYIWHDSENDLISVVEIQKDDVFFTDSTMTTIKEKLEVGTKVWVHDEQ